VFDVVSVGHFSIDSIILPNRDKPFTVLGGSAAYVSFAARCLGAKAAVISKVGKDFPEAYLWWLKQENIGLTGVSKIEDASTTSFELRYSSDLGNRTLKLKNKMAPITLTDLPNMLKSKVIHVAPIVDEVDYETIKELRSKTEILSLDPQGLVRNFENGNITLKALMDKRMLKLIDVYKSSHAEIEAVTGISDVNLAMKAIHEHGAAIVIVTLGMNGALVLVEDTVYNVPAYKPEKVVDPTGAGDVFMGAFLAEYVKGEDCSWCSHVGSAAASIVIEGIGPTSMGDEQEIYRRASLLYEKELKG